MKDETLEWKPFVEEAPGQEEKLDALESARRAPGPRIEGCLSSPRNVSWILDTCRIPGGWEVVPTSTQVTNTFSTVSGRGNVGVENFRGGGSGPWVLAVDYRGFFESG